MAQQLTLAFAPFADLLAWVAELRPTCVMALPTPAVIAKHDHRVSGREMFYVMRSMWLVLRCCRIAWLKSLAVR